MKKIVVSLVLILFVLTHVAIVGAESVNEVRVGVKITPPFVMKSGTEYYGYSIDLIEEVANSLNVTLIFVEYPSTEKLIDATAKGEVDVAIGNISETSERLKKIFFSKHYYDAGLKIMIKNQSNIWGLMYSALMLNGLLPIVVVMVLIFGHLIWFFERNQPSSNFNRNYMAGLFESIYFTVVTGTTVGYGDFTAKRFLGRIMTIIIIIAGINFSSVYTASLVSVNVKCQISS